MNQGISKISYIEYNMKSSKVTMWSRWDYLSSMFKEIDSRNKM